MSDVKSSKNLSKRDHYDRLLQSIDELFGESQDLSSYEWFKVHIMGGRDFDFRGITKEYLIERTRQILKAIDGKSRNKLPCELADDDDEDGAASTQ